MLFDVFSTEFGAYSKEYYKEAITNGMIRVNGQKVSCKYFLKNGDRITHTVHRHEPPVPYYPISIIGRNQDVFAVNKPPSIPVHACGAFRYNTLEMIIRKELTNEEFYFIHRLDRVTSGVLLIARKKEVASALSAELQKGGCHKVYLAVVDGKFSINANHKEGVIQVSEDGLAVDRNIATVSQKEGLMKVDKEEGKVVISDDCNVACVHIHISVVLLGKGRQDSRAVLANYRKNTSDSAASSVLRSSNR